MLVTTTNDIPGYKITKILGVATGVTVRSRSSMVRWLTRWQTYTGGRIGTYSKLANHSRREAFDLMVKQAREAGANAVIAMRYDATEIEPGITEVIAYGSAALVQAMNH